jgi:hypothetical protein
VRRIALSLAVCFVVATLGACGSERGGAEDADGSPTVTARAARNLGFEEGPANGQAAGWVGGGEGYILTTTDVAPAEGARSGRIEGAPTPDNNFGTYTQCLPGAQFRGKAIAYSGMVRTGDISGNGAGAGLWLRVDGPGDDTLFFDNMSDRAIGSNIDWRSYWINSPELPDNVIGVCFGVLIVGKGVVDADALRLEVS